MYIDYRLCVLYKTCLSCDYKDMCDEFGKKGEELDGKVCKDPECRHLLNYYDRCSNPDCFYHKNDQDKEKDQWTVFY